MSLFPDELRLGITVALNALLFFAAYRFARRWIEDRVQAALDAFLLWYLVQYIIVAGLGVMGVLGGGSIVMGGVIAAVVLLLFSGEAPHVHAGLRSHPFFVGASLLLLAYLFSLILAWRYAPITANDSLAYQLPAAVQWLQTGRLALLPVWFFNPANSYSPLAGSTFVAWLMGPMGNDVLARFVEAPALIFLFLGVVQLCRALGANLTVAALLGLAVACARPFISQTILAKDDLPLAAFLTAAMVALSADRLRDPLGAVAAGDGGRLAAGDEIHGDVQPAGDRAGDGCAVAGGMAMAEACDRGGRGGAAVHAVVCAELDLLRVAGVSVQCLVHGDSSVRWPAHDDAYRSDEQSARDREHVDGGRTTACRRRWGF